MSCKKYPSYNSYLRCRSLEKQICYLYDKINNLVIDCSCSDISGIPAGNNYEIQYNDNGIMGASSQFLWDHDTNTFLITDALSNVALSMDPATYTVDLIATGVTKGNLNIENSDFNILDASGVNKLSIYNNTNNENVIQSTTVASSPLNGLVVKTENIFFDLSGSDATRGMYIKLGDQTSNSQFQIRDSANTYLFSVEGSGLATFYNYIGSDLTPVTNGTFHLGANPDKPWGRLVTNEIRGSGVVGGSGISAGSIIFSATSLLPKLLYTQDIGIVSNPFRTIFARNIELGSEISSTGSLRAQNITAGRTVNIVTTSGAEISGSGDSYSYQISTGLVNGASPAAGYTFTNTITGKKQIIVTANNSTSGDSSKIFNMGFDISCNNSPNTSLEGYQLQFSTGTSANGGNLDIKSTVNLYKQNTKNIVIDGNLGFMNMGIGTSSQLVLNNTNIPIINMISSTYTITMNNNASLTRLTLNSNAGSAGSTGNSGDVINVIGGLQMGPVKNPPSIGFPIPGANITLGKYGWDGNGPNPANFAPSIQNSSPSNPVGTQIGGSGNIYCDHVRENVFYNQATSDSSIGETGFSAGFQGNNPSNRQYYNGGDLQNIIINVGNCPSQFVQVFLPKITEAMVGSTITVIRLRLNALFYPGNNVAGISRVNVGVAVTPANASTDLISCPDSIFLSGGSFIAGGVGIDPYAVIGAPIIPPVPYTPIGSATFIATQCGDGQNIDGTSENTRYIWHYINEYPAL